MEIKCQKCKKVRKTKTYGEVPEKAVSMASNYCPSCEKSSGDYWEEWYEDENGVPI